MSISAFCKAHDLKPERFKVFAAFAVIFCRMFGVMLRTVQLDYQRGLVAVEIHYILADGLLSPETHRVTAKEVVPEVVFLPCGPFPQLAGIVRQIPSVLAKA